MNGFHEIGWEVEFLSQCESHKLSMQKQSYSESGIQESLLGRVGSLIRRKSKSKPSQDSRAQTSGGLSASSGGAEFPDFQEQTQILQTRIELASKYCQRRPYKLKRSSKKEKQTVGPSMPREPPFPGMGQIAGLTGVVESPLRRIDVGSSQTVREADVTSTPSYIFTLCRMQLANPHPTRKQPKVDIFCDIQKAV